MKKTVGILSLLVLLATEVIPVVTYANETIVENSEGGGTLILN